MEYRVHYRRASYEIRYDVYFDEPVAVFSVGGTRPGSKNSITGVLPIDNIYDSDHILTLDTTFFWAKNADRPINIWRDTLSDSSNEFIHPGISYRVRKFGADPGDIIFGYDSTKGDTVTVIAKSGSPKNT